jgi:hypothetical protein
VKARTRYAFIGVVALLVVALVAVVWLRTSREREARRLVANYNAALSLAVNTLDAEKMNDVAAPREKVRVGTYITQLWGEDIDLQTELVDLEVLDIRSAEPTITVLTEELWRISEGIRSTGEVTSPPADKVQRLQYTLLRDDSGILKVYRAEILEDQGTLE